MANHVTTTVEVVSDNPMVFDKLKEWFDGKAWDTLSDTMFLYNILYPEAGGTYDRGEYSDRMGAKWAYIEDYEIDDLYFRMNTTSAWYFIEGAIDKMGQILNQIDEKVLLKFTFEDESLDPIGGGAWYKGQMDFEEDSMPWPDEDELSEEEYNNQMDSLYENVYSICEEFMDDTVSFLLDTDSDEEE